VYERGLSLNVLSKAYGLPGLRIGWLAAQDTEVLRACEHYKHYLSICNSGPSEALALVSALLPVEGFLGLNLTLPFKATLVAEGRFRPSPRVVRTGSANTLHKRNGNWCLENTDVDGITATVAALCRRWLEPGSPPWSILCLGAGGAARAVPEAAATFPGCEGVLFLCREPDAASRNQAARLPTGFGKLDSPLEEWKEITSARVLVINTLPLGLPSASGGGSTMGPTPAWETANPYAGHILQLLKAEGREARYFDMLYLPSHGMEQARALSIPAIGGGLMLQEQGRTAFQLWTGVLPSENPLVSREAATQ
jgi:shikimate 5-dehydrogenase